MRKKNEHERKRKRGAYVAKRQAELQAERQVIDDKLAQWWALRQFCDNHRKVDEEFAVFKELIELAPSDPELARAIAHYNEAPVTDYLPYIGCIHDLEALATKRNGEDERLQKFAAVIDEKVHHDHDGSHICSGTHWAIYTHRHGSNLQIAVTCANHHVANTIEDMVSTHLAVIPEARETNDRGHVLIYFQFDPTNPEAVRMVCQLKDQPGNVLQLPLQEVDKKGWVN